MMEGWIVVKNGRLIPPGQTGSVDTVFQEYKDACAVAAAMSALNPVGYKVEKYIAQNSLNAILWKLRNGDDDFPFEGSKETWDLVMEHLNNNQAYKDKMRAVLEEYRRMYTDIASHTEVICND